MGTIRVLLHGGAMDPTMQSRDPILRTLLVAGLLTAGRAFLCEVCPAADEDLARQAAVLGSDAFAVRQQATRVLIAAGPAAIPHVVQRINVGDAETRARCFSILTEQALAPVAEHRKQARRALAELALSSNARIGPVAIQLQEATAVAYAARLMEYGAVVAPQASNHPARFSVQIGQNWAGGDSALTLLTDLGRINWLSLESARVTDAGLVHIGQLTDLERLYLGNSQVRGSGLKELAPLVNLRYLSLKQLPI